MAVTTAGVLAVAGEEWELPFAAMTVADALARGTAPAGIVVPPELVALADDRLVRVAAEAPGRFRSYDEIVADLQHRTASAGADVAAAGTTGHSERRTPPVHHPPAARQHRRRRVGQLDVWTLDTGDAYFNALTATAGAPRVPSGPVWRHYGPRRPVFTRNTNDFAESAPGDPRRLPHSWLRSARMADGRREQPPARRQSDRL